MADDTLQDTTQTQDASQRIQINNLSTEGINKINYLEILDFVNIKFQLEKVIEANKWHNYESVLDHTKMVFSNLTLILKRRQGLISKYLNKKMGRYSKSELLLFVPILHDVGKAKTMVTLDGITKCPNHEQQSMFETGPILDHFGFEGIEVDYVQNLVKHHGELNGILNKSNDPSFPVQFNEFKNKNKEILLELFLHMIADTKGGFYRISDPEGYEFRIKFANKNIHKYYPAT